MANSLQDLILRSASKAQKQRGHHISIDSSSENIPVGIITAEDQLHQASLLSKPVPQDRQRPSAGRIHQVKTRLTDAEKWYFEQRLELSGLHQAEFIRQLLLHEHVTIRSITETDEAVLKTLLELSAELGHIGGMLRATVIANKGDPKILSAEDKQALEILIRQLRKLKEEIQMEVQTLCGHSEAQNK